MEPPFSLQNLHYSLWNYSTDHNNIGLHVQSRNSKRKKTPESLFGQALREFRSEAGLTQEELAFESGYHPTYIGQLERGQKNPSLKTILSLSSVLKTRGSLLVERVEFLLGYS